MSSLAFNLRNRFAFIKNPQQCSGWCSVPHKSNKQHPSQLAKASPYHTIHSVIHSLFRPHPTAQSTIFDEWKHMPISIYFPTADGSALTPRNGVKRTPVCSRAVPDDSKRRKIDHGFVCDFKSTFH